VGGRSKWAEYGGKVQSNIGFLDVDLDGNGMSYEEVGT
jgi:hypothetical protein